MTQRRRSKKTEVEPRRFGRRSFLLGAGAAACVGAGLWLRRKELSERDKTEKQQQNVDNPALPAGEWRAVWISYLEWALLDFSTADTFRAGCAQMLDDCAGLGLNTVLAQVRPFGDALYPSDYFPFSHLCTGTQGQDPGFDPLALLVEAAHARGLSLEAWVNPYRLRAGSLPAELCAASLASIHPDWVRETDGGLYLNPADPQVRQYIADGVDELCRRYDVDGVHFDDYFYPATDPAFDAADYAASGTSLALADWRRQNVNELVRLCWQTVHRYEGVRFGVSPQGNPDSCLTMQYSDAALWLAEPGYVDYLMPQLYWGLDSLLPERARAWLSLPRAEGVALYFGLGAYRIGEGEQGNLAEWKSGCALARQRDWLLAHGADGVGLYRYGSLWANTSWPGLAAAELAALR